LNEYEGKLRNLQRHMSASGAEGDEMRKELDRLRRSVEEHDNQRMQKRFMMTAVGLLLPLGGICWGLVLAARSAGWPMWLSLGVALVGTFAAWLALSLGLARRAPDLSKWPPVGKMRRLQSLLIAAIAATLLSILGSAIYDAVRTHRP
jgi:FtsH-binding integral membrane protein